MAKFFKLLASFIPPIGLGSIAGIFRTKEITGWFVSLNKPSFNPPSYLFGGIWTAFYILIGVSMFLILSTRKTKLLQKALVIFDIQLFFNFWWSILFFTFLLVFLSVIEILIVWFLIIYIISLFKKIKTSCRVYTNPLFASGNICNYSKYFYLQLKPIRYNYGL